MKPAVSIVTPTWNRAALLPRIWVSLRSQTEQNFEWIVVDDGSTDNTREVMAGFADPRIHYLWQENAGVNGARNRGDREIQAEFVVYLDSDDEFYGADALAMMLQEIRATRPEIGWVGFTVVDEAGRRCQCKLDAERLEVDYLDQICEQVFHGEFCAIYRSNVRELAAWPPYNGLEALRHWRIAKSRPALILNRPARIYHRNGGDNLTGARSLVRRAGEMARALQDLITEHQAGWEKACPSQVGKYRFYRAMYLALSAPAWRVLPDLFQAVTRGSAPIRRKALFLGVSLFMPLSVRQWLFVMRA